MAEPLSVVTEQLPKSQVGMTIEVPTEVVDAAYERVLNRLVSRAKIEGFRPGRAPRSLVEARLGPAVVREEVVEAMIPEVMRQATTAVMPEGTPAAVSTLPPALHGHDVREEMPDRRREELREPMAEITP